MIFFSDPVRRCVHPRNWGEERCLRYHVTFLEARGLFRYFLSNFCERTLTFFHHYTNTLFRKVAIYPGRSGRTGALSLVAQKDELNVENLATRRIMYT